MASHIVPSGVANPGSGTAHDCAEPTQTGAPRIGAMSSARQKSLRALS